MKHFYDLDYRAVFEILSQKAKVPLKTICFGCGSEVVIECNLVSERTIGYHCAACTRKETGFWTTIHVEKEDEIYVIVDGVVIGDTEDICQAHQMVDPVVNKLQSGVDYLVVFRDGVEILKSNVNDGALYEI